MKKHIFLIYGLVLLSLPMLTQGQVLTGTVTDSKTGKPVADATVVVKGSPGGTISDQRGHFELSVMVTFPITLHISFIGYESLDIPVDNPTTPLSITLVQGNEWMEELVISASRKEESILQSPVSIEKLNASAIRATASLDYYDALQNLKGVDMVTSALTFKQINTRGFNETGNTRFLQLIDGVDNQTPGLGFAVGNLFGTPDIDVESVELVPGTASALYGPVAFNGVLMIRTKDPFRYQGLSVSVKTGVNHLNETYADPHLLEEYSLRYAKAFGNMLAIKVTASYLSAYDWQATNYTDVDEQTPPELRGDDNPARDALNIYGDEVAVTLPGIGRVSRTGYEERDLMAYDVHSLKLSGAVQYRLSADASIEYQYNLGNGTAPYTGSNRFCLNNFILQQHRVEVSGRRYFIRAYGVLENSQDSYNARALGQLINRTWVQSLDGNVVSPEEADQMWFTRYEAAYNGSVSGVISGNHNAARSFADQGRYFPGTDAFQAEKEDLIHTQGMSGAGIISKSRYYHVEGQYDFSDRVKYIELLAGGNFRLYDMFTNGTLFDDLNQRIRVGEGGVFLQASKSLFNDRLKITLSDRYDKNQNFKGRMTPRSSVLYTLAGDHHFRVSYQTGFRNPTVGDQYIKLNAGVITVLGGVPDNSRDLNVYQNSFEIASVDAFGSAFGAAVGSGTSPDEALMANKDLLVKSDVDYIKPEQVRTFEIGYRSLIDGRLQIDASYYYSAYKDFILNTVVMEPENPVPGEDGTINPAAAGDILSGNIRLYQLYTNASDEVSTQGTTLGISYIFPGGFSISANGTWAVIDLKDADPNHIPAFNTPEYRSNLMVRDDDLFRNLGFNVAWRWQDAFDWVGTFNGLRPGQIPAYSIVDAQFSYRFPAWKTMLKLGACNLLNNQVYQAYGSPSIGAIYYVSIVFDQSMR